MFRKHKSFLKFIFVIMFIYLLGGFLYVIIEKNNTASISPIGATLHDQNTYHIPQINYFLNKGINLYDYQSFTATTPGQHLFYSFILKIFNTRNVNGDFIPLRLMHLIFNLILIFVIGLLLYSISNIKALMYLLPLISTPYFINGALYITTDNGALGFIALSLFFLLRSDEKASNITFANIFNMFSILWRQNTIWLQLPIALKSLKNTFRYRKFSFLLSHIFPLIAFVFFIVSWGGLTPKEFHSIHSKSLNFSSIIYSISLSSVIGVFYFKGWFNEIRLLESGKNKQIIFTGIVIGLLINIIIPSETNYESGRWGGYLWTISSYFPSFFERSLLFLPLTILGSILLTYIFVLLYSKNYIFIIIIFLSWILSTVGNFVVFHRYFEPTIILFFSIFTLLLNPNLNEISYGPLVLTITLLLIFILSLAI